MTPDMETPSIFVEPPQDEEQEDLIDGGYNNSLNSAFAGDHPDLQALYHQVFPTATSSSSNQNMEYGLFSALDQSPSAGQVSPLITTGLPSGLRDGSSGQSFLLSPHDQNSPSDWSPQSTSSGDGKVFSDNWSDTSSNWSPSVQSSSPSSPSLSPLRTSFNNIALADTLSDDASGPALLRQRSFSYTGGSDPQVDLSSRPRSASVTHLASSSVEATFFQQPGQAGEYISPQASPQIPNWSLENNAALMPGSPSFNNAYGFGPEVTPDWSTMDMSTLQTQPASSVVYQPPPGPPPAQATHGRSLSTHLTVPTATGLHRRGAHRRAHSHTGVHEAEPRGQGNSVRGRQRFSPSRASLSRPTSRSPSPQPSPVQSFPEFPSYLNLAPGTTPHSLDTNFFSVTPQSSSRSQSPTSPSIEITVPEQPIDLVPVINVDDYDNNGLPRRHTIAGNRSRSSSREPGPSSEGADGLHRAISDPIGQRHQRKPRGPTITRRFSGMLKPAEEVDNGTGPFHSETMMFNVAIEGVTSQPPAEFKPVVGSDKIVKASVSRRKNEAKFVCDICQHRFTAKHNLNNHMNSHSNTRPHFCIKCGQTFVTRGTHARHESKCAGKAVRKRY